ncbi:MAG: hypothetical protein IT384_11085 [Deltaproteobacteria bacterium]|nr:hypothetical protein [Deltaproteobacteria bacterium]
MDQGDAFVLLDPQLPIASLRDTLNTIETAGLLRFADGLKVAERILQEAGAARAPRPLRREADTHVMREQYLDGTKDREDFGDRLFDLGMRG